MKGGPFALSLPWPDLALGLSGFRNFSEKWTDQCDSEEKKGHCKSRAFFLKRKKRLLKIDEIYHSLGFSNYRS